MYTYLAQVKTLETDEQKTPARSPSLALSPADFLNLQPVQLYFPTANAQDNPEDGPEPDRIAPAADASFP
eukprot:CAMPEP_0119473558 /NCGR_PEP_ID=MMETSP1344-20130328/5171_1 /TAXON_ID=236787 /ORGANISM="Florenciella parvula, Strain CCMP2471" /LENGTH=69 /DNA_ID=CAMNT_0007506697 /DNA_START=135 /DNA_END=341 /DNA_ORIENTATION=-